MNQQPLKYFLGANSCEGFLSAFGKSYNPKAGWKAYIIKGGPGTGKSSFMKYIAVKAEEKGLLTELCPCSSDPYSLDAVILPEKKIVIMDGTAPHVVDPVYPGVCEKILNFGEFWDDKLFREKTDAVLELTDRNKALHKTASRYLQAAGQLMRDNYKTAAACTDQAKTLSFADKLCRRLIPTHSGTGYEWVRFVEGITPVGVVSYSATLLNACRRTVLIDDDLGSASNLILSRVREYALKNGYEIVTLRNPFLPSLQIDHIMIPALSLCIATENEYLHFKTDIRRVHARRFVNSKQLHNSRERIKFNKKATRQLLLSAAETLSRAKAVHDELEKHYVGAMDFRAVTRFAERFAKELLG